MMQTELCSWKRPDAAKLHGVLRTPNGEMNALVIMMHGIGEHGGCYDDMAAVFTSEAIGFLTFDLRGHGLSSGVRGHATFHQLRDDLMAVIESMHDRFPETPLILLGHSMGGSIVLRCAVDGINGIQGIIASSPWLQLARPPKPLLIGLARQASRIFPRITVRTGIRTEQLRAGNNAVRSTKTDALLHKRISLKLFTDMHIAGATILNNKRWPKIPLLLMQGTDDKLVSLPAVKRFAQKNRRYIYLKKWYRMRHDLYGDPVGSKRVLKYLIKWLQQFNRCQNSSVQ